MLLCAPLAARAAGGSCPSGANYINPANPTGAHVNLSSLGVTSCFYIAASGSDSNSGKTEASPWLHAPGMANCISGTSCYITPMPGEGFIFRGGDTWHYFTGSPQVGTPGSNGYAWDWTVSGTSANEIYIGVDITWFTGTEWARPIFNNDNTPVSGGVVISCTFPQGNLVDVALDGVTYVQFDNFEFTGMCWNDQPTANNAHIYLKHFGQGPSYLTSFRTLSNNYFHGWSHVAFTPSNCAAGSGTRACGGAGGIVGDTHAEQGTRIVYNVCDGSDSDDTTFNCNDGDGYDVEESVFRHSGGTMILDNCHTLHDNLFEFINNSTDGTTHSDMWFCYGEYPSNNFYYNNVIRYIGTEYSRMLSTVIWLNGAGPGFTDYIYNNVGHDVFCGGNCNNFDVSNPGTTYMIYNNTWESMNATAIWANGITGNGATFIDLNNHYITNNGTGCAAVYVLTSRVNGGVTSCSGNVFQTISAANAQGYTSANDFAPTAQSTATVGTGTNQTNMGSLFGPAFLESTTEACAYNSTNHTVSCPVITVNNRPATGAWDAGAYISGRGAQPAAPTNLIATVD
jgi:hypothetical protein